MRFKLWMKVELKMHYVIHRLFCSQSFRKSFVSHIQHAPTSAWYPGHMYKGMKQMQAKMAVVDCFLEVHDARIPFSGRNPNFYSMLTAVKPHILVLNKCDLIDMSLKDKIVESLQKQNIKNVIFTNAKDSNMRSVKQLIPKVVELVEESENFNRDIATSMQLMIIGVPNVGKSSLINRLRNIHLNKKKASHVGAAPGITKSVLEKIKISEKPLIYLFDTPGIIQPKIESLEIGLKLSLCNTLQDHLVGEELIADYLLYWLNKEKQFSYVNFLKMKEPSDDIRVVLFNISKDKLFVKKIRTAEGSYKMYPDLIQASRYFILAFRNGQLGKFCLDVSNSIKGS